MQAILSLYLYRDQTEQNLRYITRGDILPAGIVAARRGESRYGLFKVSIELGEVSLGGIGQL